MQTNLKSLAARPENQELPKDDNQKIIKSDYSTGVKIRIVWARRPGLYLRGYIFYKNHWVKWVGFAILPIGKRRPWFGLALEIPTKQRPEAGIIYSKHDAKSVHSYQVCYDPMTREPLD